MKFTAAALVLASTAFGASVSVISEHVHETVVEDEMLWIM